MNNPRVFIGSSSESIEIARAIQSNLSSDCDIKVWDQKGIFELSESPLDSLQKCLSKFHFAIFVLTPDDEITIRGKFGKTPRNNVIFELGLFLGALGRNKVFIICPEEKDNNIFYPSKFLVSPQQKNLWINKN